MQGGDLDTYIATFDHLRAAAEWERDLRGTILLFHRGLQPNLAQAVIDQTIPRPVTFDNWANATRTQHTNWVESRAVMGTQYGGRRDGFGNLRWRQALGGGGQWNRPWDPGAMDVDLAQMGTGQLSEEERKQLRTKGRCFFCKNQGHISRGCPKKRQRTGGQNQLRPVTAQITEIEGTDGDQVTVNEVRRDSGREGVLQSIWGMSATKRARLLDELIVNDGSTPSSSF